jgi:hypothetical protein
MRPIRLTDEELTRVFEAARPLAVNRRDDFLQEVAACCAAVTRSVPGPCIAPLSRPSARISTRRCSNAPPA